MSSHDDSIGAKMRFGLVTYMWGADWDHYDGWVLIEASDMPADRLAALTREHRAFDKLVAAGGEKYAS